jgi:hypothetical protein
MVFWVGVGTILVRVYFNGCKIPRISEIPGSNCSPLTQVRHEKII